MIKIENKSECCGCTSCYSICPVQAIQMIEDGEGFRYPKVDKTKCINCGLCKKVCPILNKKEKKNEPKAYACINKNEEIRKNSSSGGIFSLIAETILDMGGVVFGAQFDSELNVVHSYTENKEELHRYRGSKYVQSIVGDSYKKVKEYLEKGKYVFFTGTPCQVEGLYVFLQKDYNKLYTQDIICHGVPSPKVWHKYKDALEKEHKSKIKTMNFRDKSNSWKSYCLNYEFENNDFYKEINLKSNYMIAFLKDLSIRESCYICKFKSKNRKSDITLADFWGIQNLNPDMDDDKGTSLVMVNSQKGITLFEKIKENIIYKETNFEEAIKYNPSMTCSPQIPESREFFFKDLDTMNFDELVDKYKPKENLLKRYMHIPKIIIKKILRIK